MPNARNIADKFSEKWGD